MESQIWIVTDADGRVIGRLRSPYYSSAVYHAYRWWPDAEGVVVWPWDEATAQQREDSLDYPLWQIADKILRFRYRSIQ